MNDNSLHLQKEDGTICWDKNIGNGNDLGYREHYT